MLEGLSNVDNEKRRWPQIAGAETHPYFSGWEVGGGGGAAIFVPCIMLLLMLIHYCPPLILLYYFSIYSET
jgi:hypothetical protein